MAQCLVAETGWGAELEKAAVAHVLVKRWVMVNGRREMSLLRMVRAYCSVHRTAFKDTRRTWLKKLRWQSKTPDECGRPCRDNWQDVMDFVDVFSTGVVPDPLPTARHFGNLQDHQTRVMKGLLGPVRMLPRQVEHKGSIVRFANFFYAFRI